MFMSKKTSHILLWLVASFFYAYQYIIRVLPNIFNAEINQRFLFSPEQFGQFSGIYYIGYAVSHIPLGLMLDRFGPKKVLPVCVMLSAVGLLPMVYAEHWIHPIIGRFLMGLGSSAAILGVFKIIRMTFAEDYFTRMLGISVAIGVLGAIYGGLPIHCLSQYFSWEQITLMLIAVGVGLSGCLYFLTPKNSERANPQSIVKQMWDVFKNPYVMSVCFFAGMMVGPLDGYADVWATSSLKTIYGMDAAVAATLPSLIYIGMCVGSPVLSTLADISKRYFEVIIVSGILMGSCFGLMLTGCLSMPMLSAILLVLGFLSAYQIPAIYQASTFTPRQAALTTSLANMIIMLFGYVFHSVIGVMISMSWSGAMEQGAPYYSPQDYQFGLSVIPVASLVAAVGYWGVKYKIRARKAKKIKNMFDMEVAMN